MPQKKQTTSRSKPRSVSTTSKGGSRAGGAVWLWLALAAIIAVADQYTKTLVLGYYKLGDVMPVTSFFNITRLRVKQFKCFFHNINHPLFLFSFMFKNIPIDI